MPDDGARAPANLYVHFPFCRRKCTYCALYSRAGVDAASRDAYVGRLAREIADLPAEGTFSTVYFGGGSPALCDLRPIFSALEGHLADDAEFTVELHPDDVTRATLETLKAGGVNRISMGLQSLDDATLKAMNRGYTAEEALGAFARVTDVFANAGVDLIVGFPGDPCRDYTALEKLALTHCSVYSLQNERGLKNVPSDEWTLDRLREVSAYLESIGLKRYEISNYARPGFACRHNLATWRGEDYLGLGDGAAGRVGLNRTRNGKVVETVSPEADRLERTIFALRTREGLETSANPEWRVILDRFAEEGLLRREGTRYRLTLRGTEVCDTILSDLL